MPRIALSFALLLSFTVSLSGQVPQSSPPANPSSRIIRDSQALAAVQKAIAALGGATVIGQAQSWQIQGQAQGTDSAGKVASATVSWEMAGGEFRMAATGTDGNFSVVTGHGNPAVVTSQGTFKVPTHVIRARFVPALVGPLLLNEFQNTHYNVQYGGTTSLGSEPVTVVRTELLWGGVNPAVTAQVWYFDQASGLPVRLEFRLPSQGIPLLSVSGAIDLANYQAVSGAMYPFQITSHGIGEQTEVTTLQSVRINTNIAAGDFDPPSAPQ